ncbi:uncharacterized protein LOC143427231 [Xylocopa sonorina]|uniref:uncharacterized protein LOC143427231 n=1 Tax=Xylocopa sonorina TaxID=1818115 RepID=UPI00403AAABA
MMGIRLSDSAGKNKYRQGEPIRRAKQFKHHGKITQQIRGDSKKCRRRVRFFHVIKLEVYTYVYVLYTHIGGQGEIIEGNKIRLERLAAEFTSLYVLKVNNWHCSCTSVWGGIRCIHTRAS